jgi:lipopolysaccharide transport system permease protein
VRELWQYRQLVLTMAARAIKARYAGSVLGTGWALFEPLLQFALYLLVFGVFLGLRGLAGGGLSFALWLLAGLSPFLLLQEGWTRAAGVFRGQAHLVKHVPVPLVVLLAAELVAVLARHGVILGLLLLVAGVAGQWSLGGMPLLLAGLGLTLVLLAGGALWLSVAGAYLPDVAPLTGTLMGFALYLTPILYPEKVVPGAMRPLVALNPLWGPLALVRQGLSLPVEVRSVGAGVVFACLLLLGGVWFFRRREGELRDLV